VADDVQSWSTEPAMRRPAFRSALCYFFFAGALAGAAAAFSGCFLEPEALFCFWDSPFCFDFGDLSPIGFELVCSRIRTAVEG